MHAFEVVAFPTINVHGMLLQLNGSLIPHHHTTNACMVNAINWFIATIAILFIFCSPYGFIKPTNTYVGVREREGGHTPPPPEPLLSCILLPIPSPLSRMTTGARWTTDNPPV
jgi:hypothetical protein